MLTIMGLMIWIQVTGLYCAVGLNALHVLRAYWPNRMIKMNCYTRDLDARTDGMAMEGRPFVEELL